MDEKRKPLLQGLVEKLKQEFAAKSAAPASADGK